jgi:hypothetical protein
MLPFGRSSLPTFSWVTMLPMQRTRALALSIVVPLATVTLAAPAQATIDVQKSTQLQI